MMCVVYIVYVSCCVCAFVLSLVAKITIFYMLGKSDVTLKNRKRMFVVRVCVRAVLHVCTCSCGLHVSVLECVVCVCVCVLSCALYVCRVHQLYVCCVCALCALCVL